MSLQLRKLKLARESLELLRMKWRGPMQFSSSHFCVHLRVLQACCPAGVLCWAILSWAFVTAPLRGQTAGDHNEGSVIEEDTANSIYRFKWWGLGGRTYFLQHSTDLDTWNWLPIIETGNNSVREWGFTLTVDKFFIRLWHSDIPTTDPDGADFDVDGLGNMNELLLGTTRWWEIQMGMGCWMGTR